MEIETYREARYINDSLNDLAKRLTKEEKILQTIKESHSSAKIQISHGLCADELYIDNGSLVKLIEERVADYKRNIEELKQQFKEL